MPDAIVTALIAAVAAGAGGVLTFVLGRRRDATDRMRVSIEHLSAEAAADLSRAQASGEVVAILRGEVERLQRSYEDSIRHMAELSAEVHGLRTRLAEFEIIVLTLPEEYRSRFTAVLSKSRSVAPNPLRSADPKARTGGL